MAASSNLERSVQGFRSAGIAELLNPWKGAVCVDAEVVLKRAGQGSQFGSASQLIVGFDIDPE